MPLFYNSSMFCFDEYDGYYDDHGRPFFSISSPESFHAFSTSIPSTQIASLRSIHQRIDLLALERDLWLQEDQPEWLVENLLVDRRWKTFVEGNCTRSLVGLAGLPGLRLLSLEFCLILDKKAGIAILTGQHRNPHMSLLRAFKGLKGLKAQKVHIACTGRPYREEGRILTGIQKVLQARLWGSESRDLHGKGKNDSHDSAAGHGELNDCEGAEGMS